MTPKEKAKELVDKYYHLFSVELENTIDLREAKQCALIAVDEILDMDNIKPYILHKEIIKYYIEVKQEIENL
jgi:hypothetical protein